MKFLPACLLLASVSLSAQPASDNGQVHHLEVTGRVPGPPMWQVKNGENTLWIFGLLDSLPKGLDWDSGRVEAVIEDADVIVELPDGDVEEDIGIFGGITLYRHYRRMRTNMPGDSLDEVLPAEVYEQLLAVKEKYGPGGRGLFKLRPLFAAVELQEAANDSIDMRGSRFIEKRINRFIKRSDAERLQSTNTIETPVRELLLEIDTVALDVEVDCLRSVLENIDINLQQKREQAYAWSHGYMGDLYTQHIPTPQDNCTEGLLSGPGISAIFANMRDLWLQDAEKALQHHRTGFAQLPMYLILSDLSLIDALRDRGYEVIEP